MAPKTKMNTLEMDPLARQLQAQRRPGAGNTQRTPSSLQPEAPLGKTQ